MNTTAASRTSYSSEHSWSRRCSTETILSLQGKETDFVRDTTDTETFASDGEYEPASGADEPPLSAFSSSDSDNEIISTKVIAVSVGDDGDLEFADSEQTDSEGSDSEMDLYDYWHCAQCRAHNNNPLYRYCEKCFKVRKNFFPPRPKRKHKGTPTLDPVPRTLSQDSGMESQDLSQCDRASSQDYKVNSPDSQEFSQKYGASQELGDNCTTGQPSQNCAGSVLNRNVVDQPLSQNVFESQELSQQASQNLTSSQVSRKESLTLDRPGSSSTSEKYVILNKDNKLKRRAESADRFTKRVKVVYSDSDSDSSAAQPVSPLTKTVSDPSLTIDDVKITKKVISNTLKEKLDDNLCIICYSEPKSGVFVHGRIAHICCCYKCALKVWAKAKRCPVCNCKVSNVLKAVVM